MKAKSDQIKRPRSTIATAKSKPLTNAQVTLLRRSFSVIETQADIAALVFYKNLFALDPSLRGLFHTSIELQGRKLMEALEFTMATLKNPEELVPMLEALGRRHVTYGAKHEHYGTVTQALLQTLAATLGGKFTPSTEDAWRQALGFVCAAMQRGAREVEELVAGKPSNVAPPGDVKASGPAHR